MTAHLEIPQDRIAAFCQRHRIKKLSLFGSVLRDDFSPESDVDVLVEFEAGVRNSLFDMVRMENELREVLERKVDFIERKAVEESENYIRRGHILNSLETVYVA